MPVLFTNNARAELDSGITTAATSITLASGQGALFPEPTGGDWFPVVLQQKANFNNLEIARCTARSGDTLTIARGEEGTDALAFVAGDIVDLRLTAAAIAAINADQLDGQEGSFYRDASNLNAGTLPGARFNNTSHGSRSGGSLHSTATTSTNGFMSSSDKSKLNGIESGAEVNADTNISVSRSSTTVTVGSSTGNSAQIAGASSTNAGVMVASDKSKLDGIESGAETNVATNLSRTLATTSVTLESSTGDNTSIPAATTSVAGVMSNADKSKLNGIEAGAEQNVSTNLSASYASSSVTVASSTGSNATIDSATTSNSGVMSASDKSKLNGIEAGAEANVGTNLGRSTASTSVTVTSSTGNNTTLPAATTSAAGVMTSADKTKLNAVGSNANRALTISTGEPSGGSDGDVWYQY